MTAARDAQPYAVIGATGQQGGAVVDALLAAGAPVRAVVRDATSQAARKLAGRGVQIAVADQDDGDRLAEAFTGVEALFLMTTYASQSGGTQGEVARGRTMAEAAARAAVPRVVYSSVGGAERKSGVPHFESKRRVEQRLAELLPSSFIRPTFFMDNVARMIDGAGDDEFVLRLPLPADVDLQMIAVRDIGIIAAAALRQPDVLGSDALEIAGDVLTGPQVAQLVGAHLGRTARYEALPLETLGGDEDRMAMFRWFADTPAYAADLDRTRQVDPQVWDLAGWLEHRR
ncbi:NmrA/HSCARG family protein [Micromonospora sp. 067-2]|uniref:NmrA/HSCARG family protein n=1 Tax=Micromonospora sp. 067-2 TaxID=2789270 RepID=UPI00397830BC